MRGARVLVAALLGAAAVAVGLLSSHVGSPAASGWVAYAPLSDTAYPVLVGPPWWSIALIAVGSATVGAAVALLIVRRPRP